MQHCSPEKTLFGLIAVELLLVALFGVLGAHNDFFHLGREQNLPTWFSSMQLFFAAYCAMIVAHQESLLDEREALLKSCGTSWLRVLPFYLWMNSQKFMN